MYLKDSSLLSFDTMLLGSAAVRDLYAVLNLKTSANSKEVRAAYRRAALAAHPDKGGSAQAFHVVKFAFEVLSCSASRHIYDLMSSNQQPERTPCSFMATDVQLLSSQAQFHNGTQDLTARGSLKYEKHKASMRPACPPQQRHPPGDKSQVGAGLTSRRCNANISSKRYKATTLEVALERMRAVLQSMRPSQRLLSLQKIDPCIAASLHVFMKRQRAGQVSVADRAKQSNSFTHLRCHTHVCGFSVVSTLTNLGGARYRTQLVIRGLRLYTLASQYEDAIDHHIILLAMRDAVASASRSNASLWTDPQKLHCTFKSVLDENNTSEQEINLHTFVYMKAAPWLHQSTPITSPVMSLVDAISVYTRLLSAMSVSWEKLRAEWVRLLLCKRRGRAQARQARSQTEAEDLADRARDFALGKQWKRVESSVRSAVRRAKARAASVKRGEMRQQKHRLQQQRWLRQKDLTMDDLLGGRARV